MSSSQEAMTWLPAWFSPEQIDTVLVAFPDVFGRLMGKRLTRSHFLQHVAQGGTHACNYLLTVDMEMNPLEGFKLASWEQGYGDFHLVPQLNTLHLLPWSPGSALVLCNLQHEDERPVAEAPRTILQRTVEKLRERDLSAYMGSELEFYLFRDSYEQACAKRYEQLTPSSDYLIDYHLLQTARDEGVMRRVRNEMHEAGIIVEGSKGEWGRGQHELNLLFAEALQMADRHVIFKHGAKEIAAQEGHSLTFMAKLASDQAGSSFHLHSSLWDAEGERPRFVDYAGAPSQEFRYFLGGLMKYARELSYFFAPTINSFKRFQVASWAPTSLVWANDNRTTAFRVVGHGKALRIENRSPGADANPYLAFAATIAAGLQGIDEKIDCGDPYQGNAYINESLARLPRSLDEAADLLDGSELARSAFGSEVVDFYAHTARLESQAYRAAVTDWDLKRYFERI